MSEQVGKKTRKQVSRLTYWTRLLSEPQRVQLRAFSLCIFIQEVPHGTKGTGPKICYEIGVFEIPFKYD